MAIPTYAWVLPRPSWSRYPGGFPLHFEKKLLRLLGNPEEVLHPFGGMAEFGLRTDLLRDHPIERDDVRWRTPDALADAHALPFRSDTFDCVICDPPYSEEEARRLYNTPAVNFRRYSEEAVRVVKPGGFVALYHVTMLPRPEGTIGHCRVLLATRVWHKLRCCAVFQKV